MNTHAPPQRPSHARWLRATCFGVLMLGFGCVSAPGHGAPSVHPSAVKDDRQGLSGLWLLDDGQYSVGAKLPLTPAAQAGKAARDAALRSGHVLSDAGKKCLPAGMPSLMVNEFAMQILEVPGTIAFLSEMSSLPRLVHTDETSHPADLMPGWNGHSIGHWEGDTLAVNTVGLSDRMVRLPGFGLTTTKLQIDERMQVAQNGQQLRDTMIFTDPVNLTKPWTVSYTFHRLPEGSELWEYPCEVDAPGWKDRFKGDTEGK